jgi:hypothetical protein
MNVSGSEDKETTSADVTTVLIFPKLPLGEVREVREEDFPTKFHGKDFPNDDFPASSRYRRVNLR